VDLSTFAESVGERGPVRIEGDCTRGGAPGDFPLVRAPAGIVEFLPAEMTLTCGAGTTLAEVDSVLAAAGQMVSLGETGTVGGALGSGWSGVKRLGHGPVRDALLQCRYVNADGRVVKAGGPTVKNVSGFDLCRLMVGSRGTLGFLGEVILRTRPRPRCSTWFVSSEADPVALLSALYRPASVLWNGTSVWVCLEGHPDDVAEQSQRIRGASEVAGPPPLPTGGRRSVAPRDLGALTGHFVAEMGVGVVHHADPASAVSVDPAVRLLHGRIKQCFDPGGRLNPGVDVLSPVGGKP